MKKDKLKTQVEIFICNHKRDGEKACADSGAKDITDTIKKWAKEEHKGEIKVFRSGCLGRCSEGVVAVCYPEKKYLLEIAVDDVKEIKKGLEEALEKTLN